MKVLSLIIAIVAAVLLFARQASAQCVSGACLTALPLTMGQPRPATMIPANRVTAGCPAAQGRPHLFPRTGGRCGILKRLRGKC